MLRGQLSGAYINSSGGFQHNSLAMQVSLYMSIPIMSPCNHFSSITCVEGKVARLGELIAASVAQGGSGLYIFNRSTFNYMCGNDINIKRMGMVYARVTYNGSCIVYVQWMINDVLVLGQLWHVHAIPT